MTKSIGMLAAVQTIQLYKRKERKHIWPQASIDSELYQFQPLSDLKFLVCLKFLLTMPIYNIKSVSFEVDINFTNLM
jgi:hypothetical protein